MMLAIPIPIIWIEVVNPRAVPVWGIEHFLISNNYYYEGKKGKKKKKKKKGGQLFNKV